MTARDGLQRGRVRPRARHRDIHAARAGAVGMLVAAVQADDIDVDSRLAGADHDVEALARAGAQPIRVAEECSTG